jgi:hypothetical protein
MMMTTTAATRAGAVCLFVVLLGGGRAVAQTGTAAVLTPEQVTAALHEKHGIEYLVTRNGSMGLDPIVRVSTPYSRLTWLAAAARARFEDVTPGDIDDIVKDASLPHCASRRSALSWRSWRRWC